MAVVAPEPVVLVSDERGVRTIQFNRPKKLNGWSPDLIAAMQSSLAAAAEDPAVLAVVLTGSGKYYCAGVDFAGSIAPMHPRTLHAMICVRNQALFDTFLDFQKPIIVAVNGPAIGAAVTSAFLADEIIASEDATFSTPFKSLGLVPEGCSSYTYPKAFGAKTAQQLLEGRKLNAQEALEIGFCQCVAPAGELRAVAQQRAEEWALARRPRRIVADGTRGALKRVNAEESVKLADAMLDYPFFDHMVSFSYAKGKYAPLIVFWLLRFTRPLWSKL